MQLARAPITNEAISSVVAAPLPQEEQARADLYALIARLFIAPPDENLLAALANADSLNSQQGDNPLDIAWEKLILNAAVMDAYAVQDEFSALFISTGSPLIDPYASLYVAGFMNEKPLAALRSELAELGLARVPGVSEMEDHFAALCEVMRAMIVGEQGVVRQPLQRQKLFFVNQIASWYRRFFEDIRSAADANFYRQVAEFTQAFFSIESEAFEMMEGCHRD
ncbi:MAG: hypothetical protein V7606_4063 [Burkholderiales bacterium]